MDELDTYRNCRLCPRACGVDRLSFHPGHRIGFCGETQELRVAYVGPHFGEEPPISGTMGSGAVFFSGCSLRCAFCQNHQISHEGVGRRVDAGELLDRITDMVRVKRVHNINFVTPDHFFPHVFCLTGRLRDRGMAVPVVFNLSGYQSLAMLKSAQGFADIYLPDFKYGHSRLAAALSACPEYPATALEAISEMIRQKGFLDVVSDSRRPASKGVLVRHLILPGHIDNSIDALTSLYVEFGAGLPLSLMSQYVPVAAHKDKALNRTITKEEFGRVYDHTRDLGFERLFVQFPQDKREDESHAHPFLPDFLKREPFGERSEAEG
jgi:putative pyruvate formate lyase activating enzyme